MSRFQFGSLWQLTVVRFWLILREPEAIFWIFIFPILLAAGLGVAFRNQPPEVLPVAATTPALTRALAADKGLKATRMSEAEGRHALATGAILLLAVERANPAANSAASAEASTEASTEASAVVYEYDPTNPDARTARLIANGAIQRAAGERDAVQAANRPVQEVGSRYIDFVTPGLLGMNLMGSAMWGLGFAIVEARQKKLLKRLVASPMPRWQYLASFLLSRLGMLAIEVVAFLGFARLAFGVPLRGSLWQLGVVCVLTSMTFCAMGLLVASRARTMEAVSGLMNLTMLPMWILSGVFFSAARFPAAIQPLVQALPLTAAVNAMRGNMLQGAGLTQMMAPVGILLAWLVVPFAVSLWIFRWR